MGGRAAKQKKHWKYGSRPTAATYQLHELEHYLGRMKSVQSLIVKVSSSSKSMLRFLFFFQNLKREPNHITQTVNLGIRILDFWLNTVVNFLALVFFFLKLSEWIHLDSWPQDSTVPWPLPVQSAWPLLQEDPMLKKRGLGRHYTFICFRGKMIGEWANWCENALHFWRNTILGEWWVPLCGPNAMWASSFKWVFQVSSFWKQTLRWSEMKKLTGEQYLWKEKGGGRDGHGGLGAGVGADKVIMSLPTLRGALEWRLPVRGAPWG